MIKNTTQINWDALDKRMESCRLMYESGKEEAAVQMLGDFGKEITEKLAVDPQVKKSA